MTKKTVNKILIALAALGIILLLCRAPFAAITLILCAVVTVLVIERRKLLSVNDVSSNQNKSDNVIERLDEHEHKEKILLMSIVYKIIIVGIVFILLIILQKWWVLFILLMAFIDIEKESGITE